MLVYLLGYLTFLCSLLNALYDSPHPPESRPNKFELCWNNTLLWVEYQPAFWYDNRVNAYRAGQEDEEGPIPYVCDGTGQILIYWDLT